MCKYILMVSHWLVGTIEMEMVWLIAAAVVSWHFEGRPRERKVCIICAWYGKMWYRAGKRPARKPNASINDFYWRLSTVYIVSIYCSESHRLLNDHTHSSQHGNASCTEVKCARVIKLMNKNRFTVKNRKWRQPNRRPHSLSMHWISHGMHNVCTVHHSIRRALHFSRT